jgi:hypothetical protein
MWPGNDLAIGDRVVRIQAIIRRKAMSRPDVADDASLTFAQIVSDPNAAKPLLQKFEQYGDGELFELFRSLKETLVPRTSDW